MKKRTMILFSILVAVTIIVSGCHINPSDVPKDEPLLYSHSTSSTPEPEPPAEQADYIPEPPPEPKPNIPEPWQPTGRTPWELTDDEKERVIDIVLNIPEVSEWLENQQDYRISAVNW